MLAFAIVVFIGLAIVGGIIGCVEDAEKEKQRKEKEWNANWKSREITRLRNELKREYRLINQAIKDRDVAEAASEDALARYYRKVHNLLEGPQ